MEQFSKEQVIRLMELAVSDANGTSWGCNLIAESVFDHYNDEDGKVKRYVDTGEGFEDALEVK